MFGKNPTRSISHNPTQLAVEDVFYTIQGEGPESGRPALFIRMAGCNLACHFCDTQFETMADKPVTLDRAIEYVDRMTQPAQRRLVVLTGGEPLRQNWSRLAAFLYMTGTQRIQIETAGTLWQPDLDQFFDGSERMTIVCSPKTPKVHPRIMQLCKDWKFIVREGEALETDGLPARGTQVSTKDTVQFLYRPTNGHVWLSPCDDYDPVKNKANQDLARDLCLRHGYRLSLQMHKIIGVE